MKRRIVQSVCIVSACVLVMGAGRAYAAPVPTFADACGGAFDTDPPLCERVDYIASEASTVDDEMGLAWVGVWFIGGTAFGVVVGRTYWTEIRKWWGRWT